MKEFKNQTVGQYAKDLASRDPIPGGGSAAAFVAVAGVSLIVKAARFSLGRQQNHGDDIKNRQIIKKGEKLQKRLLDLVDLDAKAYLGVVKTRKQSLAKRKRALKKAQAVPEEVCRLCYAALDLTPFLVVRGNPYLLSDVHCGAEMLLAAFQSATINIKANQL